MKNYNPPENKEDKEFYDEGYKSGMDKIVTNPYTEDNRMFMYWDKGQQDGYKDKDISKGIRKRLLREFV